MLFHYYFFVDHKASIKIAALPVNGRGLPHRYCCMCHRNKDAEFFSMKTRRPQWLGTQFADCYKTNA